MSKSDYYATLQSQETDMLKTGSELAVWFAVKSFAGNGKCFASTRKLAQRAHVAQDTVRRAITTIEKAGLIINLGMVKPLNGYWKTQCLQLNDYRSQVNDSHSQVNDTATEVNDSTDMNNKKKILSKDSTVKKTTSKSEEPKAFPYKALIVEFNQKYATNLFPTFGKQAAAIRKILQFYTQEDIWACAEWLANDSFWKQKGFDFSTIQSQIGKYKMSRQDNSPMSPMKGYRHA